MKSSDGVLVRLRSREHNTYAVAVFSRMCGYICALFIVRPSIRLRLPLASLYLSYFFFDSRRLRHNPLLCKQPSGQGRNNTASLGISRVCRPLVQGQREHAPWSLLRPVWMLPCFSGVRWGDCNPIFGIV